MESQYLSDLVRDSDKEDSGEDQQMEQQEEQPILKKNSDPSSESTFYAEVKFTQPKSKLDHRSLIKD